MSGTTTAAGIANRRLILLCVYDCTRDLGYPPSLREIADLVELSKTAAYFHLGELQRAGLLERSAPRTARAWRLTPRGRRQVGAWELTPRGKWEVAARAGVIAGVQ